MNAPTDRPLVLHVVNDLEIGGVRQVVLGHLRALADSPFKPGLLTLAEDLDRLPSGALPAGTWTAEARLEPRSSYTALSYLRSAFLSGAVLERGPGVPGAIEAAGARIVHFHTVPGDLGLARLLSRRGGRSPALVFSDHVVRIRDDDYGAPARFLLRTAYRRLYRPLHLITVGPAVEAALRSGRILPRGRRHLRLDNTVDPERFRPPETPRPTDPEVVDFVYVARLDAVKGHETLIRAFARLPAVPAVRLRLVGPGPLEEPLRALVAEVVPEGHTVQFLGARDDVPALLREADVGLFPSTREGRPLALLEMMASGLPVVVSDIPELRGIVQDGTTGRIVPTDDSEALAEAMAELARDPGLRSRLGSAARRELVARTSDGGSRLIEFYERILADD